MYMYVIQVGAHGLASEGRGNAGRPGAATETQTRRSFVTNRMLAVVVGACGDNEDDGSQDRQGAETVEKQGRDDEPDRLERARAE